MAGQVNNIAEIASASETEKEISSGSFSKCTAKLSFNDDGTPNIVDGNYVFIKDNGTSISLNCNVIDVNIQSQIVRVVGDDNSVEEITLNCVDPLYDFEDNSQLQAGSDTAETDVSVVVEELCAEWSEAATKLLLSLYGKLIPHVKTRKIRTFKAMWEQVSEIMMEQGYRFTPEQVSNRFKTLKRWIAKRRQDRMQTPVTSNRSRILLHCSPLEKELEEVLMKHAQLFPEHTSVLEDDSFAQPSHGLSGDVDVGEYLSEDEQQQFPDSESLPYTPSMATDHGDYVTLSSSGRSQGKSTKKSRPNALEELRNLRASTLERLTCMDVKRDAFHEEVLEELRHKNSMLEKLLELVTKEPFH